MAWLDDRAWAHPKLVDLSDRAFRVYVNGISYAAGMGTRGYLTGQQQRLIGSDKKAKKELVFCSLWHEENGSETVRINDWDSHNGKRDDRRAKDRERKKRERLKQRVSDKTSAGQSADSPVDVPQDVPQDAEASVRRTGRGQSGGASAGTARAEGSEGSENKDLHPRATSNEVTLVAPIRKRDEIWDALEHELGPVSTKSERGSRNQAVKQLREIDATADEVHAKARAYRVRWPTVEITDQALVKHWSKLELALPQGRQLSAGDLFRIAGQMGAKEIGA